MFSLIGSVCNASLWWHIYICISAPYFFLDHNMKISAHSELRSTGKDPNMCVTGSHMLLIFLGLCMSVWQNHTCYQYCWACMCVHSFFNWKHFCGRDLFSPLFFCDELPQFMNRNAAEVISTLINWHDIWHVQSSLSADLSTGIVYQFICWHPLIFLCRVAVESSILFASAFLYFFLQ